MLVKIAADVNIDDIIVSWLDADQYDQLGRIGYSERMSMQTMLDTLAHEDLTLMELMLLAQKSCENLWITFMPVLHGFIDGAGIMDLPHPTLLFVFSDIPTDLAVVEMEDHFLITLEYKGIV